MFFKELNKLEEKDFAISRTPFESGRLTPKTVSKGIILNIVMQILMGVGIFAAADPMIRPEYHKLTLLIIQYSITLLLIIFSLPYLFPRYYFKKQYAQVLAANLLLLNFIGIFPLYAALFLLVRTIEVSENSFFSLAAVIVISGVFLYIATLHRLCQSIKAGDYRKDSEKHNYETVLKRDKKMLSKLPELIIFGIGIMFIINYLLATLSADVEMLMIVLMFFLLFYAGIFLFAHSTITIYCKRRFTSFHFDKEGQLFPLGSGDRVVQRK